MHGRALCTFSPSTQANNNCKLVRKTLLDLDPETRKHHFRLASNKIASIFVSPPGILSVRRCRTAMRAVAKSFLPLQRTF
ncbi:hypothetical protein B5P45_07340 [Phyllobacterium zundukense]|uniref:Uncharacterized protein n=1 Tax=Phyllobacterium zundukense TaxID=1867719 RepID=A0A2N9W177_9HYPH|nr:hypothetical protein BLM14_22685 [Phyllobacterium zundukense]PIO45495.1 hypothetical protein B5P45_07340 [Phyllobacterium zundukense]